jgi:hypothetical protein
MAGGMSMDGPGPSVGSGHSERLRGRATLSSRRPEKATCPILTLNGLGELRRYFGKLRICATDGAKASSLAYAIQLRDCLVEPRP